MFVALLFAFPFLPCALRAIERHRDHLFSDAQRTFVKCKANDHYCDFARNLRSMVAFESTFAYEHLTSLDNVTAHKFFDIFVDLHRHIAEKPHCKNLMLPEDYMHSVLPPGLKDVFNDWGRMLANYVNTPEAEVKKANDEIVDADAGENSCAWRQNEAGLGTQLEALKAKVRKSGGFMWGMQKGRGSNRDKVVMLTNLNNDLVTAPMVEYFEEFYVKKYQPEGGKVDYVGAYSQLSANDQRQLASFLRWNLSYKSEYFGLFQYGNGGKLHLKYFYRRIIHGGGIHGRNTADVNPAARMLDFGMPWIGGVSGSVLDFYLICKALGRSGYDLAEAVVNYMAALIAGHQHSLGELLFAAAMVEFEDRQESAEDNSESGGGAAGPASGAAGNDAVVEDEDQSESDGEAAGHTLGVTGNDTMAEVQDQSESDGGSSGVSEEESVLEETFSPSSNGMYFASEEMMTLIRIMNLPQEDYKRWIDEQEYDGPHLLYIAALNEFFSRSGEFEFDFGEFEAIKPDVQVSSADQEALRDCLQNEEAVWDFKSAIMSYGGYKEHQYDVGEDNHAWTQWANQGIDGITSRISAAAFVGRISKERTYVWTIMNEAANKHRGTNQQVDWLLKREANLGKLFDCLQGVQRSEGVSEEMFKQFYYLAQCDDRDYWTFDRHC
eukprot:TRINITY_DN23558_c0_g2_i1.p1 TRINITY_DN23558_c0_g2~~TRINITY_DN23558_c0_g2_i1.p1  ORF type:complete len:671 (-),score=119.95 TRINITY_DN23558_c0_g2_i1:313-2304(-)